MVMVMRPCDIKSALLVLLEQCVRQQTFPFYYFKGI